MGALNTLVSRINLLNADASDAFASADWITALEGGGASAAERDRLAAVYAGMLRRIDNGDSFQGQGIENFMDRTLAPTERSSSSSSMVDFDPELRADWGCLRRFITKSARSWKRCARELLVAFRFLNNL